MQAENTIREDLMKKYRLAGKIRLISFSLLLLFLLLMKWVGGYAYLNTILLSLILVEAICNQPYDFIVRRVNIYRLQYYQMAVDIIAITWLLYYMGGINAPVISIAYYAIILWAGVASTTHAVFFAVLVSALSFSAIVILEYSGMLVRVAFAGDPLPPAQMLSLLVGNIAYLFAFGYFSAYSSKIIRMLERRQQDESLRYAHRFSVIDHLISHTTHDIFGRFNAVKAYADLLLSEHEPDDEDNETLRSIIDQEKEGIDLLRRLSRFSRKGTLSYEPADIHAIIQEAIDLTWPVVRYSKLTIEKDFALDLPLIMAIKDQIQEVFVALILNAVDATTERSTLTIKTSFDKEKDCVKIILYDEGVGIRQEYLSQLAEPFFTKKEYRESLGTGLSIANEIVLRHGGSMGFKSAVAGGKTTFTVVLPVKQSVDEGLAMTGKKERKK